MTRTEDERDGSTAVAEGDVVVAVDTEKPTGDAEDTAGDETARLVGGDTEDTTAPPTLWEDTKWILRQWVALFVSQLSWVALKTTDSAVLGHVGTRYLSASSISDFWTMSSGVFIQGRVLSTFCGNAYGAGNYHLAGVWLQVSFLCLFIIMIPVLVLWLVTEPVLKGFGQSDQLASDAAYYAQVLSICLPVRILFSQLSQFFSAQGITHPTAVCAPVIMLLNLALGLIVVLGLPFKNWDGLGFPAVPVVTTSLEYLQIFMYWFIFCYWQGLHKKCWNGWSWAPIAEDNYAKVKDYLKIYTPAAFAIASDFWRMAFIGAVAAHIGETEAAVFNTSYRVLWIALVVVSAFMGAAGIRLGQELGKGPRGIATAKRAIKIGFALCLFFNIILSIIIGAIPRLIASIFSSDPEVKDLFETSRYGIAWLAFVMVLSVALERVMLVMGRTKAVLISGLIGSWVGQVPAVVMCTTLWKKDLFHVYIGASIGYTLLCVIYAAMVLRTDWELEASLAQQRGGVKKQK